MRPAVLIALLAATLLGACASSQTGEDPHAIEPSPTGPMLTDLARLDTLISYMTGSFDSTEQARADPTYLDIRLRITPIWVDKPGSNGSTRWLYVEQAMADQLARPYRQRIYRVSALGNGLFKSEVLELPGDPLLFAGAWKTPESFNALKADQLVKRDGCELLLTDRKDSFAGSTHERDCPSNISGASYSTSEATFTAQTLISWDRGFDESGKQVWGATKSGYVFHRRYR